MSETIAVVPLSPAVAATAERACILLNQSQEDYFFQVHSPIQAIPAPDMGRVYSWKLLEEVLVQEKRQRETVYLYGILDAPIQYNWFSNTVHEQRVCYITTKDWRYLSHLPTEAFLAYEIVENLAQMLHGSLLFHEETRGCINDMCAIKPHISFKIRTADICDDCRSAMASHLSPQLLNTFVAMLEEVRFFALGRQKRPQPEAVSEDKVGSLENRVDAAFPFPIAYCFRSMQVELLYSRKWQKLLNLNEVTLKYVTMALLATTQDSSPARAQERAEIRLNLARPALGQWREACFRLIKDLIQEPDGKFFTRFSKTVSQKSLKAAQEAASRLNFNRNDDLHGFTQEEAKYQQLYETHLGDIQRWMAFISPLATYELIMPTANVQRRRGVTAFTARILMGSHPVFSSRRFTTTGEADTDCLLHDPETGRFLSLYPWIRMDHCPECYREMVFLYDKCDERHIVMREYPTNHTKKYDGEPYEEVRRRLSP